MRGDRSFVYIGGIVDHHLLIFSLINKKQLLIIMNIQLTRPKGRYKISH